MFEKFVNYPVSVETDVGEITGVLTRVDTRMYGRSVLQVHAFVGHEWYIIFRWIAVKTGRSS
jgi:hypothetical protein